VTDPLLDPLLRRWIFPMLRRGRIFRIPFGDAERRNLIESGEYDPDFLPFLESLLRSLASPEWAPGSYYPGGWYRALRSAGVDPALADPTPDILKPFYREELRVDPAGGWWLGRRPIRGRVLAFFLKHLEYDRALGLYRVRYPLEHAEEVQYLHHESSPVRVVRIDTAADPPLIHLNVGEVEPLRHESLWLDGQDRLYTTVRPEALTAEFDDPARWTILSTLEEDGGRWFVTAGKHRLELPVKG
jgi:hypothetical protein